MGTYLELELKVKTEKHIESVNMLWNDENKGYEDTLQFRTRKDTKLDIKAIQTDPEQAHLRYIKTVSDWNKAFAVMAVGK